MIFRIKKGTVSNRSWGDVDKSSIWQKLKAGLQEGAEGVREAIREMYAVVKAEINQDLTQADCFGPHHEIQQDGSLVLNRGGVLAAVQALRGARAEPNLTSEQQREAEEHLRRHYRELELPWPGEGELVRLQAELTGEISVQDVPLAQGVDLATLKAGDDSPLEVVVEIPAGKSRRGWTYTPQALQRIVSEIMTRTASGFLGHQKPEDVEHEFPVPVTHWVGALWRDGKAYIRGVVDAAAKDLKRWIRAGRVKQVSIFGVPTLEHVAGETRVTDYQLLSIDWTPLDRAGMPTQIVAVGEMDSIVPTQSGGGAKVTLAELIAKLKELGVNAKQLVGEMGWKFEDLAGEIGGEVWSGLKARADAVGEIAAALGLAKDVKPADVMAAAKAAREAQVKAEAAERDKLVDKVIGEMVVAESARPLVKRMFQVPEKADEAGIRKALGEMLEAADVKAALAAAFKEPV
ncbi:MAG TPA: hypothetical protein GX513_10845, partial [Firmicutes bacterium]|nr:hypothetical protein [Bacillota bacterium]